MPILIEGSIASQFRRKETSELAKNGGIHRAGKQSSLFKDRNLGLNGESEHGSIFLPMQSKGLWREVMMEDKTLLLTADNNGLLC